MWELVLVWWDKLLQKTSWRHKTNLTRHRPRGWHEAQLGPYFESQWSNLIATYARKSESKRIRDIDLLLWQFAINASKVPNKNKLNVSVGLMLFYRAHAAFRGAAALGLGGAVTEAMPVLRLCLETAGYANMIAQRPELAKTWLMRGEDEKRRKAVKEAFRYSEIRKTMEAQDTALADVFQKLYERTIDFGAHPNELGATTNTFIERQPDGGAIMGQVYLQDDSLALDHWLRTAGQTGVCVLRIFEKLYPSLFQELGITERMPQVSHSL